MEHSGPDLTQKEALTPGVAPRAGFSLRTNKGPACQEPLGHAARPELGLRGVQLKQGCHTLHWTEPPYYLG